MRKVLILLFLVGSLGTLISAYEGGRTVDEWIYQVAGSEYLNTRNFQTNFEHPPLSKWIGALGAKLAGSEELFWYRVPHVILYFLGGLALSLMLLSWQGPLAAFLFGVFYCFCPNTKSMAALHITDFDVALWVTLSAALFWGLTLCKKESLKWQLLRLSFLCALFAMLSKFSGLFYLPLLLLLCAWHFPRKEYRSVGLNLLGMVVLAFLIAYLFSPTQTLWYGKGIDAQKLHNRAADHATALFGDVSTKGFWYYYLVSFVFKTPIAYLVAIGSALALLFRNIKKSNEQREALIIWVPAFLLLAYISRLNVQIGLRYYLPGILLIYLGSSIVLARALALTPKFFSLVLCSVFVSSAVYSDAITLKSHAYLSYFNILAKNPRENFSDSNIDWGQGLPERLASKYPQGVPLHEVLREYEKNGLSTAPDKLTLRLGANDLSGLAGPVGTKFKQVEPIAAVGAYEFFEVSKQDLLKLICENSPSKNHCRPQ